MPAESQPKCDLYILPSEALDMDALASALLFAEIWQLRCKTSEPPALKVSQESIALYRLTQKYQNCRLHCLLPLPQPEEFLWRQDITFLLEFIQEPEEPSGSPLASLEKVFQQSSCAIHFTNPPAVDPGDPGFGRCEHELKPFMFPKSLIDDEAFLILVDRHQLPMDWQMDCQAKRQANPYSGGTAELEQKVLAVWDHRPDTGSLPQVPLRSIHQVSSCVVLLLRCALDLGLFSALSHAATLFAIAALYLDQQQYGGLPPQDLWQKLQDQAAPHTTKRESTSLEQCQQILLQKRNAPDLDLYRQANADVKILYLPLPRQVLRIAVAVCPAGVQELQEMCEKGELKKFVYRSLQRQNLDFFVLLHRKSPQNPRRAASFFFFPPSSGIPWVPWSLDTIERFLAELQQEYSWKPLYWGTASELVQVDQLDQSISRKGFIPAFSKAFTRFAKKIMPE